VLGGITTRFTTTAIAPFPTKIYDYLMMEISWSVERVRSLLPRYARSNYRGSRYHVMYMSNVDVVTAMRYNTTVQ